MFELDFRSRTPIYEQLVAKIKELIINNVLKPDEQLPTVRMLATELTVNPNTIQKAYRELEYQKFIYSIPGKGSFVMPEISVQNSPNIEKLRQELTKIISELSYLGMGTKDIIALVNQTLSEQQGGNPDD